MRKWALKLVVVGLLGVVIIVTRMAGNPLRKPDAQLRAWLLDQTPVGSSRSDVKAILKERGWYTDGFATTQPRPARYPFLAGDLGGYQGLPWYVFVDAFWEFDNNEKLVNVRVRRIIDSP